MPGQKAKTKKIFWEFKKCTDDLSDQILTDDLGTWNAPVERAQQTSNVLHMFEHAMSYS